MCSDAKNCANDLRSNAKCAKCTDLLDPATLTSEELYALQSDTWVQGFEAAVETIEAALRVVPFRWDGDKQTITISKQELFDRVVKDLKK
jgi:hypothetical protein